MQNAGEQPPHILMPSTAALQAETAAKFPGSPPCCKQGQFHRGIRVLWYAPVNPNLSGNRIRVVHCALETAIEPWAKTAVPLSYTLCPCGTSAAGAATSEIFKTPLLIEC